VEIERAKMQTQRFANQNSHPEESVEANKKLQSVN
jgi:hypothetical protein